MNVVAPPPAAPELAAIIDNACQPMDRSFTFGGWTLPAATGRDIAKALKAARSRPRNDPRDVIAALRQMGQKADWIAPADMDLISRQVGCARGYLELSFERLNAWLAQIDRYAETLGTPTAAGYRTSTGLWHGGLSTALILAGDASALGPLALTHAMLAGAPTIAKGSKHDPLAPVLFLRRLRTFGLQVPDLLFIDTADPEASALTARLIENTRQSVVYGADATLQTIYGAATVPLTHKRVAFLSGRSGALVLDDANPEDAAAKVLHGTAEDRGNRCYSTKKVFVPQALRDRFVAAFIAGADALRRGPPEDPNVDFGRLLPDGRTLTERHIGTGTVLYDRDAMLVEVTDDAALLREEMPYPVCALRSYSPDEDPVTLFNRSTGQEAGHVALAVSVFTDDSARFEDASARLNATKTLRNRSSVNIDHMAAHQGMLLFQELMRFKDICS